MSVDAASPRMLIRGGTVLTLGARSPNFVTADVLVEGGIVAEVGPGLRARDAEVVDAADTVVMPGFVDAHRHAWRSLLRHLGGDSSAVTARTVASYGPHLRPDDVYAATLLGLLGAAEAGITTVVDWADVHPDEQFTEAALQAHADAGLRTVFVHSIPQWAEATADHGGALRRAVAAGGSAGPATTIAFGAPHPVLVEVAELASHWALARELGLRIHVHVGAESADRGIVSVLAAQGLLEKDVTLVGCAHLSDDDLDAIAAQQVAVALTPSSGLAVGVRPSPLQGLIDRGLRPGLGIDEELVAPGDLFAQMRAVQSLQHAAVFDLKLAGRAGLPPLLSTRDVIRYATVDGARAVGLEAVTGTLEPGKQADIVVLRADQPNIAPVNDPIGAVVWGMDASNVDWVFVGGRPLVSGGVLHTDVDRVRRLAVAAHDRVTGAVGSLVDAVEGG